VRGDRARPADDDPVMILVGDVRFDLEAQPPTANPTQWALTRGGSLKWGKLPGTKAEVESLHQAFARQFSRGRADVLTDEAATEAAVRERVPKAQWLHLATHGFFAPATGRDPLASGEAVFGPGGVGGFHPGLLSGLVLAGANRPPQPGRDDGILTALEVAELDLSGLEMAVLSACETGLGKVANGEGVLGLQRAFQVAGTRTTVASLWSVPDDPTRLLMERFYRNLWDNKKPMGRLEALREAQLWMLREGKAHPGMKRGLTKLEPDEEKVWAGRLPPYYWAAFVLSGDWR
jgi:CHAT domain-containing protein